MILAVGVPSLLLWVIGIPLYGLYLLRKNDAKRVSEEQMSYATHIDDLPVAERQLIQRFSFLFKGYEPEWSYATHIDDLPTASVKSTS